MSFQSPGRPGEKRRAAGTQFACPTAVREAEQEPEDVGLEPLGLGGVLDKTFQICKDNFWKLFAISAIPWLIMAAITLVITLIAGIVGLTVHSLGNMSVTALIVTGVLIIPTAIVAFVILVYLAQGAMIHAVSSTYLGREIDVKGSYRFVFNRLGKYVLTSLLATLVIIGFTLSLVVVAISFFYLFQLVTSGLVVRVDLGPPLLRVHICGDKARAVRQGRHHRRHRILGSPAKKLDVAYRESGRGLAAIVLVEAGNSANSLRVDKRRHFMAFPDACVTVGLLLPLPQIAKTVLNKCSAVSAA